MNRGVLESSPVQQLMAPGKPNWWNGRSPPPLMSHQQPPFPPQMTPNNNYLRPRMMPTFLPHFLPSPATSSSSNSSSTSLPINPNNLSSWLETNDLPPESWSLSQLLLGGLMMGEEERLEMMNNHNHHDEQQQQQNIFQGKMRLENWEEQVLSHQEASMVAVDIKQESNINNYLISSPNSPPNKSCVTTTTTTSLNSNEDNNNNNNSMLDFSSNHNGLNLSEGIRHTLPDRSSECNSLEIGGSTNKKPRLQPSASSQSTLKVRKEKLGGRVAALHQLVSPFGKTDTASVLSEAIGYIRFLHSQIEALSHPYFGTTTSGNMRHHQQLQGDMSCLFPEDPGQLLNDQCMKRRGASSSSTDKKNTNEEPKKDLKSRGLCLVPISCTLQVGSDNGADYWAPALGSGGFH